jgi:hypothetical protein
VQNRLLDFGVPPDRGESGTRYQVSSSPALQFPGFHQHRRPSTSLCLARLNIRSSRGAAGRSRPYGSHIQRESTRVPSSRGVKSTVTSNGTGAEVLRQTILRLGSKAYRPHGSPALPPPKVLTTARRVEPTRTGLGEVSFSSSALGDHLGAFSGSLRTPNTSSTGRLIVPPTLIVRMSAPPVMADGGLSETALCKADDCRRPGRDPGASMRCGVNRRYNALASIRSFRLSRSP